MEDQFPVSETIKSCLEFHRKDYETIKGEPFKHFYCPIFHVDEPARLQRGHIINDAFKGAPGLWVVQRQDVDAFFGRYFEGDFDAFVYAQDKPRIEFFSDKKLFQHFRPKLFRGQTEIPYFIYREGPIPPGHCIIDFPNDDETRFIHLCVKISQEEVLNTDPANRFWYDPTRDFRVPALVTIVKSGHLTLFSLLGYRYGASEVAQFVGGHILGRFFRENRNKKKAEVLQAATPFFHEFRHMVRPLRKIGDSMYGTLNDGELLLCPVKGDMPWAMIVFVKTGSVQNAVLFPFPDSPHSMDAFRTFLADDSSIEFPVLPTIFDKVNRIWRVNKEAIPMFWPKSSDFPIITSSN